jgi:hypothetical protein
MLTDTSQHEHRSRGRCAQSHHQAVVWQFGLGVTGNLGVVKALSALAIQVDGTIAKDVVDETVHRWLLESASLARHAVKAGRTLDLFRKEVINVYGSISEDQEFIYGHLLTLPSSPQRNRPGTHAHSMTSQL